MSQGFPNLWFVVAIFGVAYVFIITEKIHRAKIALAGAIIYVLAGVLTQAEAIEAIDWNTILLLTGMMILVGGLKTAGFFEYIAIKVVKKSKSDPKKLFIAFFALTAITSAFLSNVTTVILFAPILIFSAEVLGVSSFPYLIGVIVAADIGGVATLIGDPPNIIVASAANLSFMDYIFNVTLPCILNFFVVLGFLLFVFRKSFKTKEKREIKLDERKVLKNKKLLWKALIPTILTLIFFMFQDLLGLHTASVAIGGACLFLVLTKGDPDTFFHEVDWTTLFFLAGLLIMVGALEKYNVIELFYQMTAANITSALLLALIFVWVVGTIAAFIDRVPVTAAFIPFVFHVIKGLSNIGVNLPQEGNFFWWALLLGVGHGGLGTSIGAMPNVVVMGLSKKTKKPITFKNYIKYGMIAMVICFIIDSLYIFIRYFVLKI